MGGGITIPGDILGKVGPDSTWFTQTIWTMHHGLVGDIDGRETVGPDDLGGLLQPSRFNERGWLYQSGEAGLCVNLCGASL